MATEKKYVLEKNATTQEETLREFTPEEYAQAEADAIAQATADAERIAAEEAKAAQKLAVITALAEAAGLDVEDVTAALNA